MEIMGLSNVFCFSKTTLLDFLLLFSFWFDIEFVFAIKAGNAFCFASKTKTKGLFRIYDGATAETPRTGPNRLLIFLYAHLLSFYSS